MPSTCTVEAMRAFFADGTLPAPGTVCKTDYLPFEEPQFTDGAEMRMSADMRVLSRLMSKVRKGLRDDDVLLSDALRL